MAASKPPQQQELMNQCLRDITECPICTETFTEPKVLPCVHTFCLKCLLQFGEHENSDQPGDQLACPLCRTKFTVPPAGFVDLANNLFLNRLILAKQLCQPRGVTQEEDEKNPIHPCDICLEYDIKVSAEAYCVECEQHFCCKCCTRHKNIKANTKHNLQGIKEKSDQMLLLKMTASYCSQHPDEKIKFYCNDCDEVTCVVCHVTKHSKHYSEDVNESAEKFCKKLEDDVQKVARGARLSKDKLQQLDDDYNDVLKTIAASEEMISAAHDKLKFLLNLHRRQLEAELNDIKDRCLKDIECVKDELKLQCVMVDSFVMYCEKMKEKGTACDISRAANDLHMRSDELVKAQELYNRQQIDRVTVTFTPSSTAQIDASTPNLIGTLCCSVQQSSDITARSEPQADQQRIVHRRYENQLATQLNQTNQPATSAYQTMQPISSPSPAIQPTAKPLQTLQQANQADQTFHLTAFQMFDLKVCKTIQEITQPSQQIQQIAQSSNKLPLRVDSNPTITGTSVQPIQNVRSAAQGSRAMKFTTNAIVLHALDTYDWVTGIAHIGAELFVRHEYTKRVLVYNMNTYGEKRLLTTPEIVHTGGLAACCKNNCVYIGDEEINCIHRVDISKNTCSKWSLKAEPRGLSLTRASNLLVTLPQSIEEYTTTGSFERSITLDASIDKPRHAIELSNGQFVVCHAGSTQHRVCIVDKNARIVHSYGGPWGSGSGHLCEPCSLAVDTSGCVFVADLYNHRVQVLSPSLTLIGDVITPGYELNSPCALYLDVDNGRLYIAQYRQDTLVISL